VRVGHSRHFRGEKSPSCVKGSSLKEFGKSRRRNLMYALGHKRTFRIARAMSALPPKADIPQRGVSQVTLV